MADSETPGSEAMREAEGQGAPAPSYDATKERYAGISAGVLGDADDVTAARAFAEMIVDTVREGLLVLDLDLRVKAANESFYDTFGVRPQETVGRFVYELGDGQWDLPELRTLLEEILPHDKAFNDYEVDHDFEGIGRRVMLLNARRLDDHELILLAIEDVTERRRAEQALRAHEEQFRLLVDNAREYGILATDPERRVTMWSPGAERILGWSRDEALGQTADVIFTPEERAAGVPEQEVARARAKGSALDERWHVRKDGSRFWATGTMVALREGQGGRVRGFAKILRDNTRRKAAEEERDALLDALARERRRLRELNETLEARVEARTRQAQGLARALAVAEQVERQRIAHVLHDDLQQILVGAKLLVGLGEHARLPALLDEAVGLTRRLSHELSPSALRSGDLPALLEWLAARQRERLGLEVELEVLGEVAVQDRDLLALLYHLVRELLFNVVKHAGTKRARVAVEGVGARLRVVVEDEGVGFDPAGLELVRPDEGGATGLGLQSVRERLELVGGRLEVDSAPGRGTRVTFVVPVGEEGPSPARPT